MSLGYARDSIADLQSLAGNLPEIDITAPPSATVTSSKLDLADDAFDNVLLFDKDQETPTVTPSLQVYLKPMESTPNAKIVPSNNMRVSPEMQQESTLVVQDSPSRAGNPSGRSRSGRLRRIPSVTASENKKITATYSGFDYSDYYQDSYTDELMNKKKKKKSIFRCVFPFLSDPLLSDDEYSINDERERETFCTNSVSPKEGMIAEGTGMKNKSQEENQAKAVAPTLILPTVVTSTNGAKPYEINDVIVSNPLELPISSRTEPIIIQSAHNTAIAIPESPNKRLVIEPLPEPDIQISPQTKIIKGILKRTVIKPSVPSQPERRSGSTPNSSNHDSDSNIGTKRRSILPTYDTGVRSTLSGEASNNPQVSKFVSFSSMARVMPVLPRSEMSYYLKSTIWWQRNDYDDFKKTGRIIAKAMIQGGSEIWLQTSNAWGKSQGKQSYSTAGSDEGEQKHSAEYTSALKKYGVEEDDDDISDEGDVGNKWWCKFGHSRRGLEHIVSVGEGRQRQRLVNASIAAVLEEQRRQRISRRDSRKIGSTSLQYTGWAKDLARAAGEADEEAVKSKFYSRSKCRLSYLNTKLLRKTQAEKAEVNQSARFVLSANSAFTAELLDSHTHVNSEESKKKKKRVSEKNLADSFQHKAAGFQFQETAAA